LSRAKRHHSESGTILIIFMVALAVAVIALGAAVQAWSTTWRRDNEEELIFRGNQYVDAIISYRKEHGGQFPLNLQDLYKPGPRRLRYIRRLYKEPIGKDGKWGLLYLMPGGQSGVYDPKAAQKAQEKAAKEWGSNWETAGSGALAQPPIPGTAPVIPNQYGSGVPMTGGPPVPSATQGGLAEGEESVSEPPIGWPIIGVISRATGKRAEDTFLIYKGHEHVDEWQFHVFDRGEQVQQPGRPGVPTRPAGLGPGTGGIYPIQGMGGFGMRNGPLGGPGNGPRPNRQPRPPGSNAGQADQGDDNP